MFRQEHGLPALLATSVSILVVSFESRRGQRLPWCSCPLSLDAAKGVQKWPWAFMLPVSFDFRRGHELETLCSLSLDMTMGFHH